ncbi:MAG: methyltransferase [Candidatus Micrarchaeia archaeon]
MARASNGNIILSNFHIKKILELAELGEGEISTDLGISKKKFFSNGKEVSFEGYKTTVLLEYLEKVARKRDVHDCFILNENGGLEWIYLFSEVNGVLKLYEPRIDTPPTLFINGSLMHSVATTAIEEAMSKARATKPTSRTILDIGFGLGYTAMSLEKLGAMKIVSYEISEEALEIAKVNPWSKPALESDKVEIRNKDIFADSKNIESASFDAVLHDPPNFNKFEYLYSLAFYGELYRIMKHRSTLYHFIATKSEETAKLFSKTKRKLIEAGFSPVSESYRGLVAQKQ